MVAFAQSTQVGNLKVLGNISSSQNLVNGYASTVTSGGTTTLTVNSAGQQYFTGSSNQTCVLPIVSTLALGQKYLIINNSSGSVTVNSSGGNTLQAMAASTKLTATVISLSGTGAASWSFEYSPNLGGGVTSVAASVPSFLSVSGSPITTSGTLAITLSGTALPILNGGTGATAANAALNALLPTQTSNAGKFLTTNATNTSWASVVATTAWNVASKTTTYSAVANDYILASSSSFTITLPTAVGISGQAIGIQHAGTSLSQVYTLNTTSAQTIGGIASGSYALYTNGETLIVVSDGSNWQIQDHKTATAPVAYTPTFVGMGTMGATNVLWSRIGPFMYLDGYFVTGTATNVTASLSLPGSMTISTLFSTIGGSVLYSVGTLTPAATGGAVLKSVITQSGANTLNFSIIGINGTGALFAQTGSGIFLTSETDSFSGVRIPIQGWQP